MITTKNIFRLPNEVLTKMGWDYLNIADNGQYLTNELVTISDAQQNAFLDAGNELFEQLVAAAEHHIRNKTLAEAGIPDNLHDLIYYTWQDDRQLQLYGRFDFAGGLDGLPIRMLEFNADTPTCLPETTLVQWGQLLANNIPEEKQFNFVFEALTSQFNQLAALHPDKVKRILFSTLQNADEDDQNIAVLTSAAEEAGFETAFAYIDEVVFSETEGIFAKNKEGADTNFPFWFKLVPWEYIALDEPELCQILTEIVIKNKAVVINPAYALLLQSKALLVTAHKLFPNEKRILPASFDEPSARPDYAYVRKVLFGREGANVAIFDKQGLTVEVTGGDYGQQTCIFQALAELNKDWRDNHYQAGVFYAGEACGLGFRRSSKRILDDRAQFIGHCVEG